MVRNRIAVFVAVVVMIGMLPAVSAGADTTGTLHITEDTVLSGDHNGNVVIEADGVTLDCAGHSVTGPAFIGVLVFQKTDVSVTNCDVSGFFFGFVLQESPRTSLVDNAVSDNEADGFHIRETPNAVLLGNAARNNGTNGFNIFNGSSDAELQNNVASNNAHRGFVFGPGASNAAVIGNAASTNGQSGFEIASDDNVLEGNSSRRNGRDGYTFAGTGGNEILGNLASMNEIFGFRVVPGSDGNVLAENTATKSPRGFVIDGDENEIVDSVATFTGGGFIVGGSFNSLSSINGSHNFGGLTLTPGATGNVIEDGVFNSNIVDGIQVLSAESNSIVANTSFSNGRFGVNLEDTSTLNSVSGNHGCNNDLADLGIESTAVGNLVGDNDFCTSFNY